MGPGTPPLQKHGCGPRAAVSRHRTDRDAARPGGRGARNAEDPSPRPWKGWESAQKAPPDPPSAPGAPCSGPGPALSHIPACRSVCPLWAEPRSPVRTHLPPRVGVGARGQRPILTWLWPPLPAGHLQTLEPGRCLATG